MARGRHRPGPHIRVADPDAYWTRCKVCPKFHWKRSNCVIDFGDRRTDQLLRRLGLERGTS